MNTRIGINAVRQASRTLALPLQVHMAAVVEHFLHLPAVISQSGLFRSSFYARMKLGTFPASVKIGPSSIAWLFSDISCWMADRIADSGKEA